MMINKRLIGTVSESKKYIGGNIVFQWCSLVANIVIMFSITNLLQSLFFKTADSKGVLIAALVVLAAVTVRFFCTTGASRMGYLSTVAIKKTLRELIYKKMLYLGNSYQEQVKTSEVVQVAVEGVEQLEVYFSAYLPQFFYSILASLTLFTVLSFINLFSAIILLICVPLIPITIAVVQTWAKKLLAKYWGRYTTLGDTFLESLQGLTTLKIYQADAFKNEEIKRESEEFRKITMKVLTTQLNSLTIMDLIAYGGAALGIMAAAMQYAAGTISLGGSLLIILLSADFFIPMRQLGSSFHVAMNGMAASNKIFRLLDLPEQSSKGKHKVLIHYDIFCSGVDFSYDPGLEILKGVYLQFPQGSFTAIVGESGCGKSTLGALLMGRNKGYAGSVMIGGIELEEIHEDILMQTITYISHNSYLFKGTVRENLLMGKPDATDKELWKVLNQVNLENLVKSENGLDYLLTETASNLSGGQRQRLALARALLHDSPVYIFDEATSNIDIESENHIMEQVHILTKTKTVILISHRLANAAGADRIYVMERGKVKEKGIHQTLLANKGVYEKLWNAQQRLENFGNGGGGA